MFPVILSNKNVQTAAKIASMALALAAVVLLSACAPYQARRKGVDYRASGEASWYGPGFAGRKTSSGETYNPGAMTAAHRTLPFGTTLRVINVENGKAVVVRVNDRGPFVRGRIIDLSRAAAERLSMMGGGTARVKLMALAGPAEGEEAPAEEIRKKKKEQPPQPSQPPQLSQPPPPSPTGKGLRFNPEEPSEEDRDLEQQEQDIKEKEGMPGETDRF